MENSILNHSVQESEVIKEQSVERLYITGYEWSDYVESESDVITHFVMKKIIEKPTGEYDEDEVIEDIITNHRDEYLNYIRELRQIYESLD